MSSRLCASGLAGRCASSSTKTLWSVGRGEAEMADLKLPKLPDRTPVKITISVMPDVFDALNAYADAYDAAYGRREAVADLIPFMLDRFLLCDRDRKRTRLNSN